jgi:hypothetical protein
MLIGDFKKRLQQLNPNLVVKDDQVVKMDGLKHSGIYLKQVKQSGLSYDVKGRGDARVERYYAALESGQLDKFLCGVCLEWLPEFDVFNADYTKIAVPGWRTVLMQLVSKQAISLDKARKIFNCASLGEADYDRMNFFKRAEFAKRIDDAKL